jgi:hypothetical protein
VGKKKETKLDPSSKSDYMGEQKKKLPNKEIK